MKRIGSLREDRTGRSSRTKMKKNMEKVEEGRET